MSSWSHSSFLVLCTFLIAGYAGLATAQTYEEQLSENYTVRWTPDYQLQRVTFQVIVRTKSYVGLGISPTGRMIGSDCIIGGVYSDGRIYFADYHVQDSVGSTPQVDSSQDYHIIYAQENATHTELRFYRAFDTGDVQHDHVLDGNPTFFVYAIGGYDPVVPDDIVIHHGPLRGSRAVTILDQNMLPPRDPCIPLTPQRKELALSDDFHVQWMADLDTKQVEFYVTVTLAESLTMKPGFIGLGFSADIDGMNADTFFGGRHANGSSHFGDYHSVGSSPVRDDTQNYSPLGLVTSNATHAVLKFLRQFDTGDYRHDYNPINSDPVHLFWSYGDSAEFGLAGGATKRGQGVTRIIDPLPEICNERF